MLAAQFEAMASFDRSTAVQNWNSPLATVILFLFHSAWTGPAETQNVWWIPAGILVLVVPFFFVSYGIEYGLHGRHARERPPKLAYPSVRLAVRNANLRAYGVDRLSTSVVFTRAR